MIWRKTKIFIYDELTPSSIKFTDTFRKRKKGSNLLVQNNNKLLSIKPTNKEFSTPRYIDFYYSDLNDHRNKRKHFNFLQNHTQPNQSSIAYYYNKERNRPLFDALKTPLEVVNVKYATRDTIPSPSPSTAGMCQALLSNISNANVTTTLATIPNYIQVEQTTPNPTNYTIDYRANFLNFSMAEDISLETRNAQKLTMIREGMTSEEMMTIGEATPKVDISKVSNDKIYFFELYDRDTPESYGFTKQIDSGKKIHLEDVDNDLINQNYSNKTKYVKKHAFTSTFPAENFIRLEETTHKENGKLYAKTTTAPKTASTAVYSSGSATWSDFPFVAVYVYDPLQLRCDAAAISAHWLLASASCLCRHRENQYEAQQSAYVAYCSANWRMPECISYVKQKLIHPKFNRKDPSKQRLYNVGVVQIVNSMPETCRGWAPVTLMSHQYSTENEGSLGNAVGWGLDKYRGTDFDVANYQLMWYQSLVFKESVSCPGDANYST
ncbi:uncharacterized protein LOC126977111 [Leptidea sinapis]|uniref:uncharacterized protein LOC126977111 n=1 Tax=Leptidea sinapis TaxID=189913 RepID=UPI0021C35AB7|nr:uncharacterized protein LOC126977111 [Leptidea sinapis]